jgi:hypothetical protein
MNVSISDVVRLSDELIDYVFNNDEYSFLDSNEPHFNGEAIYGKILNLKIIDDVGQYGIALLNIPEAALSLNIGTYWLKKVEVTDNESR